MIVFAGIFFVDLVLPLEMSCKFEKYLYLFYIVSYSLSHSGKSSFYYGINDCFQISFFSCVSA